MHAWMQEEQLKGFTEVTALSPFKPSFTNADERKTSASDETKLSGDEGTKSPNDKPSDHAASASVSKQCLLHVIWIYYIPLRNARKTIHQN